MVIEGRRMSKYFSPSEFTRCTPSCKIEQMDQAFLALLDEVREAAGIPLVLNCAYRSVAWDKSKGRDGKSAHTKGKAVDIRCNSSANRYKIVAAALGCGIRRIGIAKTYVHLDNDETKPQGVIWDYYA
jgi:hypothetical protein